MRITVVIVALVLSTLACGRGTTTPRRLELYPTETILATQTPFVIVRIETTTPAPATQTPLPATKSPDPSCFTVSASIAVYLRPSPNTENYPIIELPNGTKLSDKGGRDGEWLFVAWGDKQGWVHSDYLAPGRGCESEE